MNAAPLYGTEAERPCSGSVPASTRQARGPAPSAPLAPRLLSVFLLFAPAICYLALSSHSSIHHDVWHQLALIREAAHSGRLPTVELFAYTARLPVSIQHEWGAGAVALIFLIAAGASGLVALKFLLTAPVFLSFWRQAHALRSLWPTASLLACIAAPMVSYSNVPVCAQAYSLAIFSTLLWLLVLDWQGNRSWPFLFLPLFVLWVNLHGGFAVGLGVLSVYAFEQLLRRRPYAHLTLLLVCCLACVALNPYGFDFYRNILHGLSMERVGVTEWRPFWPVKSITFRGTAFLLSLFVAAYALRHAGPRRFHGGLMLGLMALATFRAEKVVPLYAVVWFGVVLRASRFVTAARALDRFRNREPGTLLVVCAAIVPVCATHFLAASPWELSVPGTAGRSGSILLVNPVGPVDYLRAHGFRGNVMTPFEQGAYVSWKLYPAVKVGCDSRYEVAYHPAWVHRVVEMYKNPVQSGWQQVLAQYPTDLVLVSRNRQLDAEISRSPQWHRVYIDDTWRLYARQGLQLPFLDRTGQKISGTIP